MEFGNDTALTVTLFNFFTFIFTWWKLLYSLVLVFAYSNANQP